MLSKIMGDESSGSSKQGRGSGAGDSPSSLGSCGREGNRTPNSEDGGADTHLKCRRRTDGEHRGVCDTPLRRLQKGSLKSSLSSDAHGHSRGSHYEIHTYGDMLQVVELQDKSPGTHRLPRAQSQGMIAGASVPLRWLFCVGLLAYGFFVLPLPTYMTGLSVGLACGFMLGLVVVFMFAPQRSTARSKKPSALYTDPLNRELREAEILEVSSDQNTAHRHTEAHTGMLKRTHTCIHLAI